MINIDGCHLQNVISTVVAADVSLHPPVLVLSIVLSFPLCSLSFRSVLSFNFRGLKWTLESVVIFEMQ